MTASLKLYGNKSNAVVADAAAFLQAVSGEEPEVSAITDEGEKRIALATAVALASIAGVVLGLPSAINATMDLYERLTEKELVEHVAALQGKLKESGTEAMLDLGDGQVLDLQRTSVDDVVDALSGKPTG